MRILVTGGTGFIGSNLALALQKNHQVVVLDDFSNANVSNLAGFLGRIEKGDITSYPWAALGTFDFIFHQAALTDTRILDKERMMQTNVEAFRRLLDYAIHTNARVIYASSAAVYGNAPSPYKESGPFQPLNPYGVSKVMMDTVAEEYMKKHPQHIIIGLRYFNVYGPHEAHKGSFSSMIWQLSQQMRAGKRPRIFYDGEQKRDHVYIKDIVRINLLAMQAKQSCIVNAGTGKAASFNRIIEILNTVLGTTLRPEYFDCPYDFFQKHTQADLTSAKKLLGYEPQWSIEQGIRDYVEWLGMRGKK